MLALKPSGNRVYAELTLSVEDPILIADLVLGAQPCKPVVET